MMQGSHIRCHFFFHVIFGNPCCRQCCGSASFDADTDLALHFDADPDPACHFDADTDPDPDPTVHFNAYPEP